MLQDLARRAAIYLFPFGEMYRTRWSATVNPANPVRGALNQFRHANQLATHRSRVVTMPNHDTLYSSAWLDLSAGPLRFTVPEMGERYYSFAFMDMSTDNFTYVCRRLDGGTPKPRLIAGPAWQGETPRDAVLVRAPTNGVWLLGRILVDGPADVANVRALQARTLLEPATAAPTPAAPWSAPNRDDPFDLFEAGLQVLGEGPLGARDRARLEALAPLGLRPGQRFAFGAFSQVERAAIEAGIAEARQQIRTPAKRHGASVNGWNYPERHLGKFGEDDFYRAHIALIALAALELDEATYLIANSDAEGRPLDGNTRYLLRFEPGSLPPARAFWSLTMYQVEPDGRAFFVDNPLGRYALGDRSKDLKHGRDGSLEIHIQPDQPTSLRANWLPAPAGPMRLTLRAFEPEPALLDGSWRMPALRRVG